MNAAELALSAKKILLTIHVITGWTIPATELMNVLINQFEKKMLESYPNVNQEEIEYAFRNSGTTVKDWGKAMNLALIDEVLIPYLDERKRLSHELEERKEPPPEQKIYTQDQLDNFKRMWAEEFYQRIRRGVVEDIPAHTREILVKDGLIKYESAADSFFVDRLNKSAENIYKNE